MRLHVPSLAHLVGMACKQGRHRLSLRVHRSAQQGNMGCRPDKEAWKTLARTRARQDTSAPEELIEKHAHPADTTCSTTKRSVRLRALPVSTAQQAVGPTKPLRVPSARADDTATGPDSQAKIKRAIAYASPAGTGCTPDKRVPRALAPASAQPADMGM